MGFRIATNVSSIRAQKALNKASHAESEISQQLASGSRINKSGDDAAGLAISERLKGNIKSLQQANRNANDGISLIQVAEGGMEETSNILVRMRELAIQSSSDTVGDTERGFTNKEYQQLKSELQRISETTTFNGNSLLDGSGEKMEFQIGLHADEFQNRISWDASEMQTGLDALGIEGEAVDSKESAQESLAKVDNALTSIANQRATIGALQNRLQTTSRNLETSIETSSAANSRIRDVDYAAATAKNAANQVIKNAGTAVLGQANAHPQSALRLIG
ncbi:MAG: flagellin [Bacteriovoracaceae bacterium]|jgi:flagellin|nr:flagellin [Bacteriovoracaceae bacterium]